MPRGTHVIPLSRPLVAAPSDSDIPEKDTLLGGCCLIDVLVQLWMPRRKDDRWFRQKTLPVRTAP